MSKSYWFTSSKTLTLGLTWPPRGIHFWSLCHQFRSLSSFLVTTSDFFFMFPSAPERTLSSGRPGCAGGGFMRAGRLGPASYILLHDVNDRSSPETDKKGRRKSRPPKTNHCLERPPKHRSASLRHLSNLASPQLVITLHTFSSPAAN